MHAVVVYESLWGNTAAVARAIAEGLGAGARAGEARAVSTVEATPGVVAAAGLLVVGSPLLGFGVPSDRMIEGIRTSPGNPPEPPDLTQPSMRSWLDALPDGQGRAASFETRIWWSPGSAAKGILRVLEGRGYSPIAKPHRFIVTGKYGPLKDGELERARAWGEELAKSAGE